MSEIVFFSGVYIFFNEIVRKMFNATLSGIWHFGLLIYTISILILNLHLDNAPVCLCNFSLHNFVCIYAKIYIQMYCLDKLWSIKNINRYFIFKNNIYRLGFFLYFFFIACEVDDKRKPPFTSWSSKIWSN